MGILKVNQEALHFRGSSIREISIRGISLGRMNLKRIVVSGIVGVAGLTTPSLVEAECYSTIKGPIVVDVKSCSLVEASKFDTTRPAYKPFADLDPVGRKALLSEYNGLSIKGLVVRSKAIREGMGKDDGALQHETVTIFVKPPFQCAQANGMRVAGIIREQCCDGRLDAPCLLGTSYILDKPKIMGKAQVDDKGNDTSKGVQGEAKKPKGEVFKKADKAFSSKNYKEAAKLYRQSEAAGDMDLRGLYRWGFSERENENCENALVPLKKLYTLVDQKKVWAEEEADARRGVFLIARCHAKLNQPSEAVFYLEGFLLDTKKYKPELVSSLKHKDFGWIHTSKEYREFRSSVKEKLGM